MTAGESHGAELTVILDGVPAGLPIDAARDLDPDLRRRQGGHGRGRRQLIENDSARITAGVRGGVTLGSPIALTVVNRDWDNWKGPMQVEGEGFTKKVVTRVRPGHADLAGLLKYDLADARDVLERASARETAARVAAGGVAKALVRVAGISISSHVVRIGDVVADTDTTIDQRVVEDSPVRCVDTVAAEQMVAAIDAARAAGDTLGGTAMVVAHDVVAGLGSYVQWDRRLDGRIAQAMCSIPSVKGVELGDAIAAAAMPGSRVHDRPAFSEQRGFHHASNRQGGLSGGVSNGEDVWARVHFKPISTLLSPLRSVDVHTGEEANAHYERSDICVVPAGAVVAEAMLALVLAHALLEKFGGDSITELRRNVDGYRATLGRLR
jgi:chorismate synthase